MSRRTLAEIDADIDRCNWLRNNLPNLSDVLAQDRVLARLQAERQATTDQVVAA